MVCSSIVNTVVGKHHWKPENFFTNDHRRMWDSKNVCWWTCWDRYVCNLPRVIVLRFFICIHKSVYWNWKWNIANGKNSRKCSTLKLSQLITLPQPMQLKLWSNIRLGDRQIFNENLSSQVIFHYFGGLQLE